MIINLNWKGLVYQNIDFSDKYEVSEYGDIRNIQTDTILKQSTNHGGYKFVCISLNAEKGLGNRKTIIIHKAVAYNFVDNPFNYNSVDHIDCNKSNNHYSNLEWVSLEENTHRAYLNGLFKAPPIESNVFRKLTDEQVKEIKSLYNDPRNNYTHKELGEMFNVSRSTITQILNNRLHKYVT